MLSGGGTYSSSTSGRGLAMEGAEPRGLPQTAPAGYAVGAAGGLLGVFSRPSAPARLRSSALHKVRAPVKSALLRASRAVRPLQKTGDAVGRAMASGDRAGAGPPGASAP